MKKFSMLYVDRIKVEVGAGTIDKCINQVIQLAKMLDCSVEFKFNDFTMVARPDTTEKELLEIYWGEKS